jgi:integrase
VVQELKVGDSPSVEFWLKKAAHSPNTAMMYRHFLKAFETKTGHKAEEIVGEWKNIRYDYAKRERFLDEQAELIERFAIGELGGKTPKTRLSYLTGIISFYKHNKIPVEPDVTEKIYIVNHNRAIKKEEIARILENATLRDKCFFLMMLESGLRPQTLVMLRYTHIKEDFEASRVPMKINVDSEMLKDRVSARFTFIGEDGFKTLKEYLAPRMPLKDDDVIFKPVHISNQKGDYLSPSLFSMQFCKIVDKLGISPKKAGRFRHELDLYTLRKYFRNNMKTQDADLREYWMGHTLGTDRHYIDSNPEDPATVEKHRVEYSNGYPFIRVLAESPSEMVNEIEELRKKNKELEEKFAEMKRDLDDLTDVLRHQREMKALEDAREADEVDEEVKAEIIKHLEKEGFFKKAEEEIEKLKQKRKR